LNRGDFALRIVKYFVFLAAKSHTYSTHVKHPNDGGVKTATTLNALTNTRLNNPSINNIGTIPPHLAMLLLASRNKQVPFGTDRMTRRLTEQV